MTNILEQNGYRERSIRCCASCEHMACDYDGELTCFLTRTFNKETNMYDSISVSPLGICNKYL